VDLARLLETFVLLAAVVDPVGTVPVFIAATRGRSAAEQHRIAMRAVVIACGILIAFLFGGQWLLEAMHVPLAAFQVAGGIILFLFALTMVFGENREKDERGFDPHGHHVAVFPLAVPAIASPGAMMAVVLLTDNHRFSLPSQLFTVLVLLAVLAVTLVLLLAAPWLHRRLGDSGASIVSRVMGLILGSVAANHVLAGIRDYFALAPGSGG